MSVSEKVKERPILYNADNVKAILNGQKEQTRRVIKKPRWLKVSEVDFSRLWIDTSVPNWEYVHIPVKRLDEPDWDDNRSCREFCPYGLIGDRLWVREAFWIEHDADGDDNGVFDVGIDLKEDSWARVWYCATDPEPRDKSLYYSKHPSIHMPYWAHRIMLEITGVRVERLRDISISDVEAEGVRINPLEYPDKRYKPEDCIARFADIWDSIHSHDGYDWRSNPWVWVISFKRL